MLLNTFHQLVGIGLFLFKKKGSCGADVHILTRIFVLVCWSEGTLCEPVLNHTMQGCQAWLWGPSPP